MTPTAEEILAEIDERIAGYDDEVAAQFFARHTLLKLKAWIKARMTEGGCEVGPISSQDPAPG